MAQHIDLAEEIHWASRRDVQSRFKLFNNLDRVLHWVETGQSFPILVNMTLTNRCNHRCPLCTSREYLDDRTMPTDDAKRIIAEVARLGAKAIGLGGGGDPTCPRSSPSSDPRGWKWPSTPMVSFWMQPSSRPPSATAPGSG